jgi:hypothetical protein
MTTRKKEENEKLPFRLKLKKYKMLLFYYFKGSLGRFNLAYFLFIVNIILFSFVLVPNLVHRASMPIGSWPLILELHGKVLMKAEGSNSDLFPAAAIDVRIGGYNTATDSNGEFYLMFTSKTYTDIPIVFCWSNNSAIEWISFQQGQFEKEEIFVLE